MFDCFLSSFASEKEFLDFAIFSFFVSSSIIAGSSFVFGSPYGSQSSYSGSLAVNGRAAWIIMELVSPLVFVLSYVYPSQIGNSQSPATFLFLLMWVAHYANRSIVYPLRQPSRKPMHIGVMLSACFFNVVNGYVNGRWLATLYPEQSRSPVLIISGIFMFALGMFGNIYHDEILIKLKKQSKGYSVPFGGQYGLVSCPHFLSELVEWIGFAVATGSPAAWVFALNVACNLIPRAMLIHRWYMDKFKDYPSHRKAMLPYLL